jgi:hypothetical protein
MDLIKNLIDDWAKNTPGVKDPENPITEEDLRHWSEEARKNLEKKEEEDRQARVEYKKKYPWVRFPFK